MAATTLPEQFWPSKSVTVWYKILEGDNLGKFGELQEISKIFFPKIYFLKAEASYFVFSQLAKQCFETKQHVILQINSNFYGLNSS